MNNKKTCRQITGIGLTFLLVFFTGTMAMAQDNAYYQLKIYQYSKPEQAAALDHYLKDALVPALHRDGAGTVGVFQTLKSDEDITGFYVLIPFEDLSRLADLEKRLNSDRQYQKGGSEFINAKWDQAPYDKIQTIILKGFPKGHPLTKPSLSAQPEERVYELRSYKGPTERYFHTKLKMFDEGGEISIFNRLNFNPVFYGAVIAGDKMPNLMYLTTYNSMEDRDAHWKTFSSDPQWSKLKVMPEYDHNVSQINITFLHPTAYSDL